MQARIRSDEGRDLVLHVSAPPEAPGYLDLIDRAPRSADAVAQDEVEVLVLPAPAVRRALIDHPRALMEMSIELAGIIRLLDELALPHSYTRMPLICTALALALTATLALPIDRPGAGPHHRELPLGRDVVSFR